MALTACPECTTEVADTALKCPKCGVQLRKPKRTFFGKLVKWSFIGFNLLMLAWLITGVGGASQEYAKITSDAGRAGAAIGTGLGLMVIGSIWVVGDLILGLLVLLTRPKY